MSENANLYCLLHQGFGRDLDAMAVETPTGARLSFAELDEAVGRYAATLAAAGAVPGDRIAVQVDKSPEALVLYLASLRGGFVYLPLNTAYPEAELDYFIGDAEPAVVVCRPQDADAVAPLAERHGVKQLLTLGADGDGTLPVSAAGHSPDSPVVRRGPDDPAAILYTSGTTGRPKGAVLSHDNLGSNAKVLHDYWGFREGDVLLHALPMFHTHGLFVACNTSLLNGTPMLFCPRFDVAEILGLLPRATVFMGVPTFYVRLLGDPAFDAHLCENMRLFVSGSAPLLTQTFEDFRERTGHTILERYGMTECGMSTSNPLDGERRAGTVGFPLPGVSLRVVDETGGELPVGEIGSIEFTGPHVFKGYWRNPEKTAEEFTPDGFFKSGDLGSIDAQGYVSISGRGKDLIITGGYNVYPKEVERCLDDEASVLESAVVGLPHPDFGEQVTAVVVAAEGERPEEARLIESLKGRLASYKVPKRVFVVDALPRNAMGKVQKNVLRDRYS